MKKLTEICKMIFGYGIMIPGDTAALICEVTYKQVIPVIVKISTIMILLGLGCMYMSGEKSLTPSEKKKKITDKK